MATRKTAKTRSSRASSSRSAKAATRHESYTSSERRALRAELAKHQAAGTWPEGHDRPEDVGEVGAVGDVGDLGTRALAVEAMRTD